MNQVKALWAEVKSIFKQITWPDKKDLIKLTGVVIFMSALMGLFLSGIDLGLTKLMGILTLGK